VGEHRAVKHGRRKVGYLWAIIFDVIFLYVVNNLLTWGVPFLTESFDAVRWVISLSLVASMIGNLLLLIYDGRWFRHLAIMAMNVFSFVATYTLLIVFPFDFGGGPWSTLIWLFLVLGLIGIAIGTIVEFFKFIFGRD